MKKSTFIFLTLCNFALISNQAGAEEECGISQKALEIFDIRFDSIESMFQVPEEIRQLEKDAQIKKGDSPDIKEAKSDLKSSIDQYYATLAKLHAKYDKSIKINQKIDAIKEELAGTHNAWSTQTIKNHLRLANYQWKALINSTQACEQWSDRADLSLQIEGIEIDRHLVDMVTPSSLPESEFTPDSIKRMQQNEELGPSNSGLQREHENNKDQESDAK